MSSAKLERVVSIENVIGATSFRESESRPIVFITKRAVWVRVFILRRHAIVTLALLFLGVFPVVSGQAQLRQPIPHLRVQDIRGRKIHLRNYQGKVVLINFWATWCPPCRAEIPDLVKLQRQYRSRGLRVIGITYPPQKVSDVRQFARSLSINYPVVLGTKETKLLFTSSEELPVTIVIGKDGVVHDIIEGILLPQEIEQRIKPLLTDI